MLKTWMSALVMLVFFVSFSSTRFTDVGVIVFNRSLLPGSYCHFDANGRVIALNYFSWLSALSRSHTRRLSLICALLSLTPCTCLGSGLSLSFFVEISIVFATLLEMFAAMAKDGRLGILAG